MMSLLLKRIRASLYKVIDSNYGINIMDLGLIYGIIIDENKNVHIRMTLPTPGAINAESIKTEVRNRIRLIKGIGKVFIKFVWDPIWQPFMISEDYKNK